MQILTFDIETDNLIRDVKTVHCIVTEDVQTGQICRYHDYFTMDSEGTLKEGIEALRNADCIVGHNIAGYDVPVLNMLEEAHLNVLMIDTMLLSAILYPFMKDNSLEQWAKVLKLDIEKVANDNWEKLTPKILDRCVKDVKINTKLFLHLKRKLNDYQSKHGDKLNITNALQVEQKVSEIHSRQVVHGLELDVEFSEFCVRYYRKLMDLREQRVLDQAPKKVKQVGTGVTKAFAKAKRKADPINWSAAALKLFESAPEIKASLESSYNYVTEKREEDPKDYLYCCEHEGTKYNVGDFCQMEILSLNINSDQQVKEFLLGVGWEPTEWNWGEDEFGRRIKTSPKLTEDSYNSLPPGIGRDIAEYRVLKHRHGLLRSIKHPETKGAIPLAMKRYDPKTKLGNIYSDAFTCGTNTGRYRHTAPIANIPTHDDNTLYAEHCRKCYRVKRGAYMVGVDKSGIEARMLCHFCYPYPGGPEFAELVLHGDWHTENSKIWGVSRGTAKVILYAMMYGASDYKLGKEAGGGPDRGKEIRDAFMASNPAYAKLVEDLDASYTANGGWIPSMDGRPIKPKSKKDTLNALIQGNCAVLFKHWMIRCDKNIGDIRMGYAHQIIAYHDELQFAYYGMDEVYHPECFAQRVVEQIGLTGKDFNLNVSLTGEYKIGKSWQDTH